MASANYINASANYINDSAGTCPPEDGSIILMHFSFTILLVLAACRLLHLALRRFNQPRIISEVIVGLLLGNLPIVSLMIHGRLEDGFQLIEGIVSPLYMFVLGLEMEPLAILHPQGPEAKIAFCGIASTFGVYLSIYTAVNIRNGLDFLTKIPSGRLRVVASFLVMFSATSSPIVTRLVTELKLSQTEIGKNAIKSSLANDLICTIMMCILVAFRDTRKEVVGIFMGVSIEMVLTLSVMRLLFKWVNKRNPEGKPFNGFDMALVLATTQFLCYSSMFFKYDAKLNAFLIGLALPRQGRVSNFLISKINYYLTTFLHPLYLSMTGVKVNFRAESERKISSWATMAIVTVLATIGKTLGTLIISMRHGLHWLEAITLGVILSMKGYFQIFFSMHAKNRNLMSDSDFTVMIFVVVISIVYVPFLVSFIVRKVRKINEGKARLMGLQWYNPATPLKIVVGLPGAQHVTPSINLIKMMVEGSEGGVVLYATDMIELTEETKAALVFRQGTNALMVADDAVIKLRDRIGKSLDAQIKSSPSTGEQVTGKGNIALRRNIAISSFSGMYDDICANAQDNVAVLIVLPFHKTRKPNGGMDAGHPGFKTVNENVLRHARCSVGILIDRGLGRDNISVTSVSSPIHVVVVFIGGADDREALACAAIMAQHPNIRLLTIRIIADMESMIADRQGNHVLAGIPNREIEMEVDDEYFAGFYEQYIKKGRVEYMEKHVKNGAEAVRLLRGLPGEPQLFIVGQGSERNSVLTVGLSEWAEYPELGPIGDILAADDFPLKTTSVLVIQQHNPSRGSR